MTFQFYPGKMKTHHLVKKPFFLFFTLQFGIASLGNANQWMSKQVREMQFICRGLCRTSKSPI